MVPPLLRLLVVWSVICLVLLSFQQPCLSADPNPPPHPHNHHHPHQQQSEDGPLEAVEESVRDSNTSRAQQEGSKRGRRVSRQIAEMEKRIGTLEDQLFDLHKFVSKQQKEKCANGQCPVGAMKYGCHCLLYVHKELTWTEAYQHCADMTGKLVSITSHGMQKHIKKFLKAQLGRHGVSRVQVLTGLIHTKSSVRRPSFMGGDMTSFGGADGWYWMGHHNLTRLQQHHFSDWADGQPPSINDTGPFKPSCMHLEGKNRLQWVTTHCDRRKMFICHFNAVPARHRRKKKGRGSREGHGRKTGKRGKRGKGRKHRHGKEARERGRRHIQGEEDVDGDRQEDGERGRQGWMDRKDVEEGDRELERDREGQDERQRQEEERENG